MPYLKELMVNGKLDTNQVLKKMNSLRDFHMQSGMKRDWSVQRGFDYGRDLIGFDMAEAWRMGAKSHRT